MHAEFVLVCAYAYMHLVFPTCRILDSLQISEGELSNLKVKDKQEGLKLKFGVMNEADNEIVKFDGKMSDGSALPVTNCRQTVTMQVGFFDWVSGCWPF